MNPDDFALSAVELDRIFTERIAVWRFGSAVPAADPLLILVGAQPGAGKTRSGRDAITASGQNVTPIVGDELRLFHPAYRELLKQSPADMPVATAQASGAWVERSIEFAATNRISVLVEGTFRNPDTTRRTAQRFKDAGFTVQAVLMAVPPEVSRASIAGRYVEDMRQHGQARFTPLQAHDDAFRALPDTLAAIAAAGSPVDRLTIRNRDALLFDAVREDGAAIHGALEVANSEWNRALSDAEYKTLTAVVEDAANYFHQHLSGDLEAGFLVEQMEIDRRFINLSRSGGWGALGATGFSSDMIRSPSVTLTIPAGRCGKPRTNGNGVCMRRVGEHGCPYHG